MSGRSAGCRMRSCWRGSSSGRTAGSSEAAFAALVARHGPMVLGVCRRVLGDEHVAADAFQAVFLVLARKARSVRVDDSLGRWLHGVSVRVARRARAVAAAERSRVQQSRRVRPGRSSRPVRLLASETSCESVIDEEIARLPGRYRSAVVLCYLEGLTQEQAARRLRCPVGTVESRLHRARERLRPRLSRRGLAPTAGSSGEAGARRRRGRTCRRAWPRRRAAAIRLAGGELAGAVPAGRRRARRVKQSGAC